MERDNQISAKSSWIGRIACISTGRADSGIYAPLVEALSQQYDVSFLAGGTHLSSVFGNTVKTIIAPPGARVVPVFHFASGDDPHSVCSMTGRAVEAFSQALSDVKPDLVFVLGDRTEMLAAALAVTIHRIPIAHLHGGETTSGAYDDACRHAITKLSHVHFAAMKEYGDNIIAMREASWRVLVVGAPALDAIANHKAMSVAELSTRLELPIQDGLMLVAYHPETLSELTPGQQIEFVLQGIGGWRGPILFVGSNADVGHGQISDAVNKFVAARPNARAISSLSRDLFWSCLAHARVLVGNSSAGILEAASFKLPAVNVGDRQKGRVRPANVIDAPFDHVGITAAIRGATSDEFRGRLMSLVNPYGDGHACRRIMDCLSRLPDRQTLLLKSA